MKEKVEGLNLQPAFEYYERLLQLQQQKQQQQQEQNEKEELAALKGQMPTTA